MVPMSRKPLLSRFRPQSLLHLVCPSPHRLLEKLHDLVNPIPRFLLRLVPETQQACGRPVPGGVHHHRGVVERRCAEEEVEVLLRLDVPYLLVAEESEVCWGVRVQFAVQRDKGGLREKEVGAPECY